MRSDSHKSGDNYERTVDALTSDGDYLSWAVDYYMVKGNGLGCGTGSLEGDGHPMWTAPGVQGNGWCIDFTYGGVHRGDGP